MNGEIKLTCNGHKIEAEVHLEHVDYEDRMHLLNAMVSVVDFRKEDLLLFLLTYGNIKDAVEETKIDMSGLHEHWGC